MYPTLKCIKSKYRSVLTDEHLNEPVRTAFTTVSISGESLCGGVVALVRFGGKVYWWVD
jgi:hypothetical protein